MNIENHEQLPTAEITSSLLKNLDITARNIIAESLDISIPENRKFLEDPDDCTQHEYHWHQWGVITHTKMFLKDYEEVVPEILQKWGIDNKVKNYMLQQIDGRSKDDLLKISIVLHDLGKFAKRKIKGYQADGKPDFSFAGHPKVSGEIIQSDKFQSFLKREYGLSENQIKYISECARIHFDVAHVRDKHKKIPGSYTVEHMSRDDMNDEYLRVALKSQPFAVEAGLLFLGDSLAKNESLPVETDNETQMEIYKFHQKHPELDPNLLRAVWQKQVSLCVAKKYLQTALSIDQNS